MYKQLIGRYTFSKQGVYLAPQQGGRLLMLIKQAMDQARLWTCRCGDISTPSFNSHLNPILTKGGQIVPTIYVLMSPPSFESHRCACWTLLVCTRTILAFEITQISFAFPVKNPLPHLCQRLKFKMTIHTFFFIQWYTR